MTINTKISLLVFYCFANFLFSQEQFYFRHFTINDGLPTNAVYDIDQMPNGDLIFGTDNGLSFFNGTEFNTYNTSHGLVNPFVTEVESNEKGEVFFICYDNTLQKFINGKIFKSGIKIKFNEDLLMDSQHVILKNFSDNYSYSFFDKKDFTKKKKLNYEVKGTKNFFTIYRQNANQFIQGKENELKLGKRTFKLLDELPIIRDVYFRKNDVVLIGFKDLYSYNYQGKRLFKTSLPKGEIRAYRRSSILDEEENVWIAQHNVGLHKLIGTKWEPQHQKLGLTKNENINSIFQDYKKGIWVATFETGVFYIPNQKIKIYYNAANTNNFKSIAKSDQGNIYVTSQKEFYQFKEPNFQKINLEDENFESLENLTEYNGNVILSKGIVDRSKIEKIGRKINDVFIYNGKNFLDFNDKIITYSSNDFFYFSRDFKTQSAGAYVNVKEKQRFQNLIPYKGKILHNSGKKIYLSDFVMKNDSLAFLQGKEFGINSDNFMSQIMTVGKDSLLVVDEKSIKIYRNKTLVKSIKDNNGNDLPYVNKIFYRHGVILLCSHKGLFKINPKTGEQYVYNKYNSLPENNVTGIVFFKDEMILSTDKGLVRFPLQENYAAPQKPYNFVRGFKI